VIRELNSGKGTRFSEELTQDFKGDGRQVDLCGPLVALFHSRNLALRSVESFFI
jgi:hypothetical protein